MKKLNKGFTLIELLVVIAIIGILSAVVLASLNIARAKGADAAIKANLANIRAQAEIWYDSPSEGNGTYTGICSQSNVTAQLSAASLAASLIDPFSVDLATDGSATQAVCHEAADGTSWAASVPLKTDSANSWCVDSKGTSKELTGAYVMGGSSLCE